MKLTKYYCDLCKKEIEVHSGSLQTYFRHDSLDYNISVKCVKGVPNRPYEDAHLCMDCVIHKMKQEDK